jgi:replicative DNA helicase
MTDKILPQNIEIETAVLGSLIQCFDECDFHLDLINRKSFYKLEHQKIFDSIIKLNQENKVIDLLTVVNQLRIEGNLEIIGGPLIISKLTNTIGSVNNFQAHCFILKEKELARKLILLGQTIIKKSFSEKESILTIVEEFSEEIFDISNFNNLKREKDFSEMSKDFIKETLVANDNNGIIGLQTGFREKDTILKGYKGGQFIVKGARPGMGKTSQILCEIYNIGYVQKKPVILFSLEMSRYELFKRLLSIHHEVGSKLHQIENISIPELALAENEMIKLSQSEIIIVDNCMTIVEVRNRVKKENSKTKLAAIYIDYLQLMDGEGFNRENIISTISRGCKRLAMDLNIPVVALSQLGRSVELRGGDKRPMLSDLRESGAIEQDADIVEFIYRPQYYGIMYDEKNQSTKRIAYIFIAKNRSGRLKDLKLNFIHNRTLFTDFQDIIEPEKN